MHSNIPTQDGRMRTSPESRLHSGTRKNHTLASSDITWIPGLGQLIRYANAELKHCKLSHPGPGGQWVSEYATMCLDSLDCAKPNLRGKENLDPSCCHGEIRIKSASNVYMSNIYGVWNTYHNLFAAAHNWPKYTVKHRISCPVFSFLFFSVSSGNSRICATIPQLAAWHNRIPQD
jgi:hypothetical protein